MAITKLEEKKVKPIVLTDTETGEKYTLEFSRETVKWAEAKGFVYDDVTKFPQTLIPDLFFYAFRMHHKNVARDKTDKIIADWGGIACIPEGVLERLAELYMATFGALADEDEGAAKNFKVTVEL